MSDRRQSWGWRDSRTGMRWSASTTRTREQAEAELQGWRVRDARGRRPDLHDDLPFVEVFLVWEQPLEQPEENR